MRLFLCAALSAAVLIAMSGCGSDEPSPTTAATTPASATTVVKTTTTPTKDAVAAQRKAFLKKVDPICEDYNREVRNVQADLQSVGRTGNVDVYAPPLKRATKAANRASKRFSAVTPPEDAAEAAAAALIGRALQAQATGNELLLQAAEADDAQQFGVATEALKQVTPKLQGLMRQYGMTVCGAAG